MAKDDELALYKERDKAYRIMRLEFLKSEAAALGVNDNGLRAIQTRIFQIENE